MTLTAGYLPKPSGVPYVDGSETIQDMEDSAIQEADFQTQQGLSKHRTDGFQAIASMAGTGAAHATAIELTSRVVHIGQNAAGGTFNYSLKPRAIANYNLGDDILIISDEGFYGALVFVEAGVTIVNTIDPYYDTVNPAIYNHVGILGGNHYAAVPQVGTLRLVKVTATSWFAHFSRNIATQEDDAGFRNFYTEAHGFSRYNVVYQVSDNVWAKAIANDYDKCRNVAIVCGQFSVDNFAAVTRGIFGGVSPDDDGTFVDNTQYYLSDSTPGAVTATKPTAHGSFVKPLFITTNERTGYFIDTPPRAVQKDRVHILHNITGLTGGGATNLDGLTSADWDDGTIVTVYITGKGKQEWQWNSGADAENGVTIVRADDALGVRYLARVA